VEPDFWEHARSIATRDFSKNPSRALRDAEGHPVVITKYGQPVACLVSMEYWYGLRRQAQERALDERESIEEIRPVPYGSAGDYCPGK
jgi:prevent-host-death family protein